MNNKYEIKKSQNGDTTSYINFDINHILNELFSFRANKRRDNINDMIDIYKLLGSPCKNSKIIHIAGTNGKGSTASFIENILFEAGYSVGKFTSPHIEKYNERIVFNNKMINDKNIAKYYEIVMKIANEYNDNLIKNGIEDNVRALNFFEITFFIALLYFQDKNANFIVLETGLGGRVDATNTINSDISVITNISFDHTSILGNTLEKIAYEKCGIIKNNELCIYSQNLNALENAIKNKTSNYFNVLKEFKNIKIELDKTNYKTIISFLDISENSQVINSSENFTASQNIPNFRNKEFSIPLFGKFQGYNFLLAYKVSKIYNIDDDIIQKGVQNTYWPARFEFFRKNPDVILDAAHNDDSIKKLSENLKEIYKKEEIIIITSVLETKDFKAVFPKLEEISNMIYVTSLKDVTYGLTALEIKEKMEKLEIPTQNIVFEDDILFAYKNALKLINLNKNNSPYKAIVICGSFYEISKFRNLIKTQKILL